MFSGFIFDVEGTLVDSVPENLRSLQDALEANTHLIGALIRVGQEVVETGQIDDEVSESTPLFEEV